MVSHMSSVPPTTAIRRNRAHNVDTPRLLDRRAWLIAQMSVGAFDSRMDFAVRAYELQAIENVLVHRGVLSEEARQTMYGNDRVPT